jgi:serine/threonine protein kinase
MKHLVHRNIVRLFDVVLRDPHLFLVLELCEFGDLSQLLRRSGDGRFSEARARFFAMQLRDGLEFLHDRRIMHRDLKPQNLLLGMPPGADAAVMRDPASAPYLLKIADFGFARELNDSMAETICVPADHELLTERGFMDLAAYEQASGVRVAGFCERSRQLVFERPLGLKRVVVEQHALVEFTDATSDVSLLVTRDHEMFVQSSDGGAYRKVRAATLVDSPDWREARHLACAAAAATADGRLDVCGAAKVRRVATVRERDELVHALLVAGVSPHFEAAGDGAWLVSHAAPDSRAAQPLTRKLDGGMRNCAAAYSGRVWCFAMPSGFVWARRVRKDDAGVVVQASRALLIGNCGSPLYMAPEVLRGDAYEQSADLFSVGAIVFEMLVGAPPFKARTPMELQRMHETTSVAFPASVPLSPACVALLSALLRREASQRLSHADFFTHAWLTAARDDVAYAALIDLCLAHAAADGSRSPPAAAAAAGNSSNSSRRNRAFTSPLSVSPPGGAEYAELGTSPGALLGLGHSISVARRASGVDAAESDFLAQAVHVGTEESIVRDIERRRKCALAVAEEAGKLADARAADAMAMYVAALAALRVALQRAENALPASAQAGGGGGGGAAAPLSRQNSNMQPIRVSLALGSLRQAARDILQNASSVRDDLADGSVRRDSLDTSELSELRAVRRARGVPFVNGDTAALIMERALHCGRTGGAAELQGTFGKSTRLYTTGLYLVTFLLDAAVDDGDCAQLREYARLFDERRTKAKQRAAADE